MTIVYVVIISEIDLDFTTIIVIVLSIRVWGIHTQSKGWGWGSLALRVNDDFYDTPQWGVIAMGRGVLYVPDTYHTYF
jgi:hypothetical protein